ncbi:hypothetical protein SXCC_02701 [Gluconacetobacter sp. SXCC-1]|nr:hypothetical protein SXCC_02701 [Gluconacetobacter sp. SXCC-1]
MFQAYVPGICSRQVFQTVSRWIAMPWLPSTNAGAILVAHTDANLTARLFFP